LGKSREFLAAGPGSQVSAERAHEAIQTLFCDDGNGHAEQLLTEAKAVLQRGQ